MVLDATKRETSCGLDAADELAQLRARGEEAVVELFGRYRPRLARMIVLRLDDRMLGKIDVEDVLQDAYVETARRIEDYLDRPSVPFFVWLRQIAGQVLIDAQRRYLGTKMRDVNREMSLCAWGGASASSAFLAAELADSLTTPSQRAVRNEMVCELRDCLEKLDEIDREVLVLRHLEELSNNEVAGVLGIDKYAASKRYLRAIERLRGVMCVCR